MPDRFGRVLSEELTVVLACDFVLGKMKGPVVVNMSTTALVDHICSEHGVELFRSRVGEANVVQVMKKEGAVIGGEGNGGVIFPALHYGRDAMVGAALILQSIAEKGKTLEDVVAVLPPYRMVKRKLRVEMEDEEIRKIARNLFKGEINEEDGIRIDMKNGWIHIRKSNTEPIIRVIAEALSEEEAEEMIERFVRAIGN